MPGVIAAATISSTLRKLFRPLESQGLCTSLLPMFSIRTARFDSQVCSQAPSPDMPQPMGERQFWPSMVPPWTRTYLYSREVTSSTFRLATSVGWWFEAHGCNSSDTPAVNPTASDKITNNDDIRITPSCLDRTCFLAASLKLIQAHDTIHVTRVPLRVHRRDENSRRGGQCSSRSSSASATSAVYSARTSASVGRATAGRSPPSSWPTRSHLRHSSTLCRSIAPRGWQPAIQRSPGRCVRRSSRCYMTPARRESTMAWSSG